MGSRLNSQERMSWLIVITSPITVKSPTIITCSNCITESGWSMTMTPNRPRAKNTANTGQQTGGDDPPIPVEENPPFHA